MLDVRKDGGAGRQGGWPRLISPKSTERQIPRWNGASGEAMIP